jgi:hypothetical protein
MCSIYEKKLSERPPPSPPRIHTFIMQTAGLSSLVSSLSHYLSQRDDISIQCCALIQQLNGVTYSECIAQCACLIIFHLAVMQKCASTYVT